MSGLNKYVKQEINFFELFAFKYKKTFVFKTKAPLNISYQNHFDK